MSLEYASYLANQQSKLSSTKNNYLQREDNAAVMSFGKVTLNRSDPASQTNLNELKQLINQPSDHIEIVD